MNKQKRFFATYPCIISIISLILFFEHPVFAEDHIITPDQAKAIQAVCGIGKSFANECELDGVSIEKSRAICSYICKQDRFKILLHHSDSQIEHSIKTAKFSIALVQPSPHKHIKQFGTLIQNVRDHEHLFHWGQTETTSFHIPLRSYIARDISFILIIANLFLCILFVSIREFFPSSDSSSKHKPLRFAIFLSIGFFCFFSYIVHYSATNFHFSYHDLLNCYYSALPQWFADSALRTVGVSFLFRAGLYFDHASYFYVGANLIAFALGQICVYLFFRNIGHSRAESMATSAIVCCAPGTLELIKWSNGFQQLLVFTIVLGSAACIAKAVHSNSLKNRFITGLLITFASTLLALGIFVKFAVAIVIPPTLWLVGKVFSKRQPRPLNSHLFYVLFFAIYGVIFLAAHPTTYGDNYDIVRVGSTALISNFLQIVYELRTLVYSLLAIMAVALVHDIGLLFDEKQNVRHIGYSIFRGYKERIFEKVIFFKGHGGLLFTLLISLLWMFPFLLNTDGISGYYPRLMFVPLAGFLVKLGFHLGEKSSRRFIILLVLLITSIPLAQIRDEKGAEDSSTATWLSLINDELQEVEPQENLFLFIDCAHQEAHDQARMFLDVFYNESGGEAAIRSIPGWEETTTLVLDSRPQQRAQSSVYMGFCPGRGFRLQVSNTP